MIREPDDLSPALFPAGASIRDVYTPSRLNREARRLLEQGLPVLWLEGEVSNLSRPASGHWYFSLKDHAAQLRCAMFRQRNLKSACSPRDGLQVLVRGKVSLYEPRGDYQLIVEHMEEAGEGALRQHFELLKARLAAEGLFAEARKRPLPVLPHRIGVITSPTGAALRDILNVLKRRFPAIPVLLYPVPVQGENAASLIAAAIRLASSRRDCDVLILARGGGSLEDLWAFNEEVVARAIADCDIPVVSGVGHETDVTIADFAADLRAPTPSGAAELVVPDRREWLRQVALLARRLQVGFGRGAEERKAGFLWLTRRLRQLHPGLRLVQFAQRLDELDTRLARGVRRRLEALHALLRVEQTELSRHSPVHTIAGVANRLAALELRLTAAARQHLERSRSTVAVAAGTLRAVSPLATLERGYAIVTDEHDAVITDAAAVTQGQAIRARLARGRLRARVESSEYGDSKE